MDHWTYWYGDLFRVTHNRVGNAAMKHFDGWLRQSFKDDKPYDRLVTEMLTASAPNTNWMPDAAPSTFLARWYVAGATMYSDHYEDTADEIFVQSARLFLGVNYQCISCHDGKGLLEKVDLGLTAKRRRDFWSMAAFFGGTRVRVVRYQDRFTVTDDGTGYDTTAASTVRLQRAGEPVQPTFILTGEKADPSQPLRPQFARMLTTHPQFARATVNLIWKEFFGLGIVDPVDGFDMARQDPASPPPAPWTVQPTNPASARRAGTGFRRERLQPEAPDAHHRPLERLSALVALRRRLEGTLHALLRAAVRPAAHRRAAPRRDRAGDAGVRQLQARKDLVYDTPMAPVRFWTEAPTPEEIGDGEARAFLQAFGQANREQFDRQSGGSILQAMMLMNSPFVNRRVRPEGGSRVEQLVKSSKTSAEIVDALYLATLSRYPTADERQLATSWLDKDRQPAPKTCTGGC